MSECASPFTSPSLSNSTELLMKMAVAANTLPLVTRLTKSNRTTRDQRRGLLERGREAEESIMQHSRTPQQRATDEANMQEVYNVHVWTSPIEQ